MTHKDKIKLARKLQSDVEKKLHTPLFDSANWLARKEARKQKVIKEYMSALGRKGGGKTKANMPPDYYKEISKKGVEARKAKKNLSA